MAITDVHMRSVCTEKYYMSVVIEHGTARVASCDQPSGRQQPRIADIIHPVVLAAHPAVLAARANVSRTVEQVRPVAVGVALPVDCFGVVIGIKTIVLARNVQTAQ